MKDHPSLILALIVLAFILFHTCTHSDYTDYKPINDSTLIKANLSNAKLSNDITKLTKQTDSLKAIKQGLKIVYKENVKRIYLIGPDTCKTYFDTIIKMHDKINLINDSTISMQDSIIKDYSRMIINYKDIVMVKDIQRYNDSIALRKQKRNKIKVGVGAFLGGLLIGILK
jgi:xanthine dehydrogenase iron-sulfur cluster and FAD-binding subunit A